MKKLLLIAILFPALAACGQGDYARFHAAADQVTADCAPATVRARPDCLQASLDKHLKHWRASPGGGFLTEMLSKERQIIGRIGRPGGLDETRSLWAEHDAELEALQGINRMFANEEADKEQAREERRERNAQAALIYLQMQSQRPVYVQPAPQPYQMPQPVPMPRSTICNSSVNGNMINTYCTN